ncbi:Protein ABHD13 [Frankliniella fusca]|uniref:Protein ABHD13 n=1 Tax=Frankliniella fusca TaxID=407009 RepID=A0AAE1I2X1_9NEOP|nr:Protein ABHD13 [Frankliniella fusca]
MKIIERDEKIPECKIPINIPMPVKLSLKILALFLLLLQKSWMSLTVTAAIFTVVYIVVGGWISFLFLFCCVSSILYQAEDGLLYYPDIPKNSRVVVLEPTNLGMPNETVYIRSADGTLLHCFLIRQPEPICTQAPTILFLHGNAGNVGNRLPNVLGLYKWLGANILLLEYRGFGLSKGKPSEEGFYADARAALNYLHSRNDINNKEIIVFGRSLGGAVAIDVASCPEYSSKIWAVVVENTFTSVPDMAKILIGSYIRFLPLWCHKNKFLSCDKIIRVTVPCLFLSGLSDDLVPPAMMDSLFNRCGSTTKQKCVFPLGTHNETWRCQGYFHAWMGFFLEIRKKDATLADCNITRSQPSLHLVINSE